MSLSARRAWIEISYLVPIGPHHPVALRKESVDRNVQRAGDLFPLYIVALRKESVDSNVAGGAGGDGSLESLSARRAWIEIPTSPALTVS